MDELSSDDVSFDDVNADAWYSYAVNWMVENGITTGVGDNQFAPHAEITREQTVTLVWRMLQRDDIAITQVWFDFSDWGDVSEFARESIQALANMGIMQGNADGTFAPQGTITRAELSAMTFRISNLNR